MAEKITYSQLRNQLAKALEETVYLLRSPKNATRLRAAHEEIEREIARRKRQRAARR